MAEKRMFSKNVVDSDDFKDMPLSAQALYFHLGMNADDEGFLNNAKGIRRSISASDDDLKLLILKGFIIPFESGVVVIVHWKMHNQIQPSRLRPTQYIEEKGMLNVKENKAYTLISNMTECRQIVDNMPTGCQQTVAEISVDKSRIDKDRSEAESRFTPPSVEDVRAYCNQNGLKLNANRFVEYYTAQNWKHKSGSPVDDWPKTLRSWANNERISGSSAKAGIQRKKNLDDWLNGIVSESFIPPAGGEAAQDEG